MNETTDGLRRGQELIRGADHDADNFHSIIIQTGKNRDIETEETGRVGWLINTWW